MSKPEVVLAFSGGLDTSYCVPWLREQGYEVITLYVNSGGVSEQEVAAIEARAYELGAREHISWSAGPALWDQVVVPLLQAGASYQDQYPLLCSDRYLVVQKSLEICRERDTPYFAHGCTGMGNDQVRFDVAARSLGGVQIIAPVREAQADVDDVRAYEQAYLAERGFSVSAKSAQYTVNENLLGVTVSGSEIDEWKEPGPGSFMLCAHPDDWPDAPHRTAVTFEAGTPVALNGKAIAGHEMLAQLNRTLGAYGVGRGIYTGDTCVGLKGRIVFEAPGLHALQIAHRALEEAVSTRLQNQFKPQVAHKWVELVYQGFFYDPLKADLEAYLRSSQRRVNGTVQLHTAGGSLSAVGVDSAHILKSSEAVYAQKASWNATEATGFIKLFGQSSMLWAEVNAKK